MNQEFKKLPSWLVLFIKIIIYGLGLFVAGYGSVSACANLLIF